MRNANELSRIKVNGVDCMLIYRGSAGKEPHTNITSSYYTLFITRSF